jgi:protein-S-isoprenylcysteine O-methyltransferase Ste14
MTATRQRPPASRSERALAAAASALFLVLAPGTVAGYVPWRISRWRVGYPGDGTAFLPLRVLGALLIAAGLGVLLDSFARFALQGVGTPAPPLPTRHLVVSGLYRHVRNPMYVAVAALILGQGAFFGSLGVVEYGALVWVCFHVFVLAYEEPTLRRQFGDEYEAFRAHVPRWLPRLTPWHPRGA